MPLSIETLLNQQYPNLPIVDSFNYSDENPNPILMFQSSASNYGTVFDDERAKMVPFSESLLGNSSPPISGTASADMNKSVGGNKRKRNNGKFEDKSKEVIRVRAKRGQATGSHSLAERVRREKINEKLKCLQDLVPGCYKAMGMAVMFDVIINYVQSLQHQIQFLSLKLSAASVYFDFNTSEMDASQSMPRSTSTYEIQDMENMIGEGYGGGTSTYFNPTWPFY
ncbi:hypothetical protein L6164_026854 [Bauhinia variegata]|uniref:Uncharacterized protein n=1 Tax=Bauhinia variegata TaxID=167791 RepID=A0ACB9LS15_BAUVA|nr:hypothetical protein L6164_026854 [Bauhinia variegata]